MHRIIRSIRSTDSILAIRRTRSTDTIPIIPLIRSMSLTRRTAESNPSIQSFHTVSAAESPFSSLALAFSSLNPNHTLRVAELRDTCFVLGAVYSPQIRQPSAAKCNLGNSLVSSRYINRVACFAIEWYQSQLLTGNP